MRISTIIFGVTVLFLGAIGVAAGLGVVFNPRILIVTLLLVLATLIGAGALIPNKAKEEVATDGEAAYTPLNNDPFATSLTANTAPTAIASTSSVTETTTANTAVMADATDWHDEKEAAPAENETTVIDTDTVVIDTHTEVIETTDEQENSAQNEAAEENTQK